MRLVCLALVLLVGGRAAADARDEFYRGANLAQEGRPKEAVEILSRIADQGPSEPFADDALLEVARLREEKLGDPLGAAQAYERLVAEFPQSRLVIRARRRAEALRAALGPDGSGAAPLAAFQDVLSSFAARPREESMARVERLLADYPAWTDAPRARLWLGALREQRGELDGAMAEYRRVTDAVAEGEWAVRGWRARGDLLLLEGDLDGAAAAYRRVTELARTPTERAMASAAEERLATASERRVWERVAWVILAGFLGFMLISARRAAGSFSAALRGLVRPPTEALYLLPIAALLTAAALTEHVLLGHAVTLVALGGVAIAWLNGAVLAFSPPGRARVALHIALCAAAVVAIAVIAVLRGQLVDLIAETWQHGTE